MGIIDPLLMNPWMPKYGEIATIIGTINVKKVVAIHTKDFFPDGRQRL